MQSDSHAIFWLFLFALLTPGAVAQDWPSPGIIARLERISVQLERGEEARALGQLEALSGRVRPGSTDQLLVVRQYLALLLERDRLAEARALLENVVTSDTVQLELRYLYGYVLALTDDLDAADAALDLWREEAGQGTEAGLFLAGLVKFRLGDYDAAADLVTAAVERVDPAPFAWTEVQALAMLQAGRVEAAEQVILAHLVRDPSTASAWRLFAHLAHERDDADEAAARLEVLLATEAAGPDDIRQAVHLLARGGIPERAARLLEAMRSNGSEDFGRNEHVALAALWMSAREHDLAIEELRTAVTLATDTKPSLMLAQLLLQRERPAEALTVLQAARLIDAETDAGQLDWLLGIAAWHVGDFEEARAALLRAERSPRYADEVRPLLRQLASQP